MELHFFRKLWSYGTMPSKSQATWGGRFSSGPSELMQRFSESVSFDQRLAVYDIACSRAHAEMLKETGLINTGDFKRIAAGLRELEKEVLRGDFAWDPQLEDVHMNLEQALTRRVPAAARLHTGRSRNDQVATDMRLYFRDVAASMQQLLLLVMESWWDLARRALKEKLVIPGYTHLQRAQPVPVAHHLHAYVEMFWRDFERFGILREAANVCPLGSGALAGSTLPLDREFVAKALGFVDRQGKPRVTRNSMDAVADRDLFLDFAHAASTCSLHMSRVAEDLILWSSSEFGFVALPDSFTTGSSLMPQKKNPDALELIRGKTGRILGHQYALQVMVKGLPLTYNRDLQEDKPPVFDAEVQLRDCLQILAEMAPGIEFRQNRMTAAVCDPLLLATDLADFLVEQGMPFREAHHLVGALVKVAEKSGKPLPELETKELEIAGVQMPGGWREVFSLERSMDRRRGIGMGGWEPVRQESARWKRRFSRISTGK